MVDIRTTKETTLQLGGQLEGEVAFVIVKGEIKVGDEVVGAGKMLVSKTDANCQICMQKSTVLLLFGGEPLVDEPFLLWNFASSDKQRLRQAKEDWMNKKFPKVPNDDTYVPFPGTK